MVEDWAGRAERANLRRQIASQNKELVLLRRELGAATADRDSARADSWMVRFDSGSDAGGTDESSHSAPQRQELLADVELQLEMLRHDPPPLPSALDHPGLTRMQNSLSSIRVE